MPAVKPKVRALTCERAEVHAKWEGVDFDLFATADLLDLITIRSRWIRANAHHPDQVKRLAEIIECVSAVLAARERGRP